MLLLGEGSEATDPYNKYDKIRSLSIRSLQFDQKVRPPSFRPEKFDLFTGTHFCLVTSRLIRAFLASCERWTNRSHLCSSLVRRRLPILAGAFRGLLLHEEGQAVQSAEWRRGWDKRGEVRTLGISRPVSGLSKRADDDQRL